MLNNPVILAFSFPTEHDTVWTDPSDTHFGSVLLKEQLDANSQPTGSCSITLKRSERKPVTTHREYLFVIWAALRLRPHLDKNRLTGPINHEAFEKLSTMSHMSGKLARWSIRAASFELNVMLRSSTKHEASDFLCSFQTKGAD